MKHTKDFSSSVAAFGDAIVVKGFAMKRTQTNTLVGAARLSAWKRMTAAFLAATLAIGPTVAAAQTMNPTSAQALAYARQMYGSYRAQANASNYTGNAQALNSAAQSNANCTAIATAGTNAARQYVRTSMPPNPMNIIKGTTCFIDIMDISIPTTGIGFIDFFIQRVVQWVKNRICQATQNFWSELTNKMNMGQYTDLLSGNPLSMSIWRSGAMSGPATMATTPTTSAVTNPVASVPAMGQSLSADPAAAGASAGPAGTPKSADLQIFTGSSGSSGAAAPTAVDTFVRLLSR
jgi:hypothetical protein